MHIGNIKPLIETPYVSDKVALLLSVREREWANLHCIASRRGHKKHKCRRVSTIVSGYSLIHAIAAGTELFRKDFDEDFIFSEQDEPIVLKYLERIDRVEDKLLSMCDEELQERKQLIDQQSFSTSFLEGEMGVAAYEDEDSSNLNIVHVFDGNTVGVKGILQCNHKEMLPMIKWIQAMLQLEGDDRFSTYQMSATYNRTAALLATRVNFSNKKASVIVTGFLTYDAAGNFTSMKLDKIWYKAADATTSAFYVSDLAMVGSTKAALRQQH